MNQSTHSHALLAWTVVVTVFMAAGLFYLSFGTDMMPFDVVDYKAESQAPADDIGALEQELQAIQTDELDAELMDIEKELAQ